MIAVVCVTGASVTSVAYLDVARSLEQVAEVMHWSVQGRENKGN